MCIRDRYKVVANDYKKGFVLYDQQQINLAYVNLKGKVKFEKNVEDKDDFSQYLNDVLNDAVKDYMNRNNEPIN